MGPPLGSLLYEVRSLEILEGLNLKVLQTGGFPAPFVAFGCVLVMTSSLGYFVIEPDSEERKLNCEPIKVQDYIRLLKIPAAVLAMTCTLLNVASDIFVLITLNSHLTQFNVTHVQSGFVYLCLFLSYGISSPLAGKIADKTDLEFALQCLGSASITGM